MTDVDEIISQLETQNSALKARLDEAESSVRKLTVERDKAVVGLKAAMLAVPRGVRLDALQGIADHVVMDANWKLNAKGQYVRYGPDGLPENDEFGEDMTIQGAVRKIPEFFYPGGVKPAASAPASGPASSGQGAADANPWKSGNLTLQGPILRDDPERALRLAKEAGKPVVEGLPIGVMPATVK